MGNLIIKPNTGGELKLQEDGGTDAIAINTSGGVSGAAIKDEDAMGSNSATHLATQQSIKAYVDSAASQATTAAQGVGTGNTPEFAGLTSTQDIVMSDGKGIDFSAYTDGSVAGTTTGQVLYDYEEGTWPGVAAGGTTAGSTTGSATGTYTKIGNLVTATISFAAITIAGASGNMTVTGLPFIAAESGVGSVKAGQMSLGGYPVSTIRLVLPL
jgi:hypothetical protein